MASLRSVLPLALAAIAAGLSALLLRSAWLNGARRARRSRRVRPRRRPDPRLDPRILPRRAVTYAPYAWFRPPPFRTRDPPPPPPPRIYRDQLAFDPDEALLLLDLRSSPADANTRLVYADLLEQRGLLAMANFVRGTDADDDPNDILEQSDLAWRALASCDRVRCQRSNCTWDQLTPSPDDERCRYCATCSKTVRYCATIGDERACCERGEHGVVDRAGAPRG